MNQKMFYTNRMFEIVLRAWAIGMLLSACGSPLSNDRFEDDALFKAALPSAQVLVVTTPDSASAQVRSVQAHSRACPVSDGETSCNPDAYRQQSIEVAQNMNDFVGDLLGLLDRIRAKPPTARTETTRVWGPAATDSAGAAYYRLSISWEDPLFSYYLFLGDTPDYQGDVVMHGWFTPGSTAQEGQGELTFDLALRYAYLQRGSATGTVFVTYDTRGSALSFELQGYEVTPQDHTLPIDDHYAYSSSAEGSGLFFFDRPRDLDDPLAEERYSLWSTWNTQGGRSDLWVYVDDASSPVNKGVECWNAALEPTYFYGACDQGVTWSDAASCQASAVGWEEDLWARSGAQE